MFVLNQAMHFKTRVFWQFWCDWRTKTRCLVTLQTSSHSGSAQCVARPSTDQFQLCIPANRQPELCAMRPHL